MNVRHCRLALLPMLALALGGQSENPFPPLTAYEVRLCKTKGGYESRAPFGYAFCQKDYSDGGKICLSKTDCEGRCVLGYTPDWMDRGPGMPATGKCEARLKNFDCSAEVENGKIATPYTCID